MSFTGCQINPTDVNFHLQKSLEFFDKNSAGKIWSKKDKEIKVSPLMPIRVKLWLLVIPVLAYNQYFSLDTDVPFSVSSESYPHG